MPGGSRPAGSLSRRGDLELTVLRMEAKNLVAHTQSVFAQWLRISSGTLIGQKSADNVFDSLAESGSLFNATVRESLPNRLVAIWLVHRITFQVRQRGGFQQQRA